MAFDLNSLTEKAKEAFKSKNFLKSLFLGLSILTIILLLSAILFKEISQERYGVLYANLSPEDAGKILSVLQEEKIPYKVEGDGKIILVPKNKIYDIRLKLAAKGLPASQNVGFELFEEPKMGITHFQESINYVRALEGELARTIKRIDAIEDARVNIALPKDSIFAREEDEAKASVIISLWPGRTLTKEQVKAIVFLVSHAVPKLKSQNVTVVDNTGRVLSDILEESDQKEIEDVVDLKRKLRRDIEKSVESMLARALGAHKVVVRANVEIETAKIDKRDEIYDPDKTAVVSERKIQEKEKSAPKQATGSPGTPTNVPATINTSNNQFILDRNKKDTTTNYDVTKSLIVTKQNVFKVKKITVGVLIDGKYVKKMDKNGTLQVEFVPRSAEELKSFENLIKSAIGYDPKRGDQVTVVSVPFETTSSFAAQLGNRNGWQQYLLYGAIGFAGLAALLIVWLLIKQKKERKRLEQELQEQLARTSHGGVGAKGGVQNALHELEEDMKSMSIDDEPIYQKFLHVAQENPDLVASLVSKWIKEEGGNGK